MINKYTFVAEYARRSDQGEQSTFPDLNREITGKTDDEV